MNEGNLTKEQMTYCILYALNNLSQADREEWRRQVLENYPDAADFANEALKAVAE